MGIAEEAGPCLFAGTRFNSGPDSAVMGAFGRTAGGLVITEPTARQPHVISGRCSQCLAL
jgi:hypothetical protein